MDFTILQTYVHISTSSFEKIHNYLLIFNRRYGSHYYTGFHMDLGSQFLIGLHKHCDVHTLSWFHKHCYLHTLLKRTITYICTLQIQLKSQWFRGIHLLPDSQRYNKLPTFILRVSNNSRFIHIYRYTYRIAQKDFAIYLINISHLVLITMKDYHSVSGFQQYEWTLSQGKTHYFLSSQPTVIMINTSINWFTNGFMVSHKFIMDSITYLVHT